MISSRFWAIFQTSGQVAQSVEQRTEIPGVGSSILSLATSPPFENQSVTYSVLSPEKENTRPLCQIELIPRVEGWLVVDSAGVASMLSPLRSVPVPMVRLDGVKMRLERRPVGFSSISERAPCCRSRSKLRANSEIGARFWQSFATRQMLTSEAGWRILQSLQFYCVK